MALLYKSDGKVERIKPAIGNTFNKRELMAYLDGEYYFYTLKVGEYLCRRIVRQSGYNEKATVYVNFEKPGIDMAIFGDAIILTSEEAGIITKENEVNEKS